jgi:serine/threonine protein kinase
LNSKVILKIFTYNKKTDLLWTAPEHLKQTKVKDRSVNALGSQHGDIYSFGIIMQEIIVRGAPFCMMGLTEEGVFSLLVFFFQTIF